MKVYMTYGTDSWRVDSGNMHGALHIEEVEAVKTTPQTVVVVMHDGRTKRYDRVSQYYAWHDSREDAIKWLQGVSSQRIEELDEQIAYHKNALAELQRMADE